MKTKFYILFALLALSVFGQQKPEPKVTLTPQDVKQGAIRLISDQPDDPAHNLVFRYARKTSDEIKAIVNAHLRVQIVKDGAVVVRDAGCTDFRDRTGTNYVGLVLLFHTYNELKVAEKTLSGDK